MSNVSLCMMAQVSALRFSLKAVPSGVPGVRILNLLIANLNLWFSLKHVYSVSRVEMFVP